MFKAANRIVHHNPNIQKFTIRYSHDSWFTHGGGRAKQIGKYEVLTGPDGLPSDLLAYEWGTRAFGQPYSRTCLYPLRSMKTRQGSVSSIASWRSERAQSLTRSLSRRSSQRSIFSFR
jgi:hypothetical protein